MSASWKTLERMTSRVDGGRVCGQQGHGAPVLSPGSPLSHGAGSHSAGSLMPQVTPSVRAVHQLWPGSSAGHNSEAA